jgi:hypothetical protein
VPGPLSGLRTALPAVPGITVLDDIARTEVAVGLAEMADHRQRVIA